MNEWMEHPDSSVESRRQERESTGPGDDVTDRRCE